MEQAQPKKGMSKGCLVGLIIAGVLVLIIVIGGITCWYYKDDLAKMAAGTALNGIKEMVAENPPEGIDTVKFNALIDSFTVRVNQEELSYERFGAFMQPFQGMMSDKKISRDEAAELMKAMTEYFPNLKEAFPSIESENGMADSLDMVDSTVSQ